MTAILAIETATEACSVALLNDGNVIESYQVAPRQHTQLLLGMVEQVLAEGDLALEALDAIAFGRGPGAFTGVRIATAVVQGLAFAADIPVIPVSTLAALATGAQREYGAVHVATAIDARMNEVYWGCFRLNQHGEMQLLDTETVIPPEATLLPTKSESSKWTGVGTGWASYQAVLRERHGSVVERLHPELLPHAQDIASLALHAWGRGEVMNAASVVPIYLRDNVAKKTKG